MSPPRISRMVRLSYESETVLSPSAPDSGPVRDERRNRPAPYWTAWYATNVLFVICLLAVIWFGAREYSTRRYLKGFSDAIIPFSAPPIQKVQAILGWMSHSPARVPQAPASLADDRDPTDTLNYASLLRVCGTATNAFVNLADSGGLTARRLLLLDAHQSTVHVTAEVLIDGRWIVVDPTFRAILRPPDGSLLTRGELVTPSVLASATQGIAGYDPNYVFDRAVHVRLARFGSLGEAFGRILDGWFPGWDDSAIVSLLLERQSLGLFVLSLLFLFVVTLSRTLLSWYGETRLGVKRVRFRTRLHRMGQILLEPAD